MDDRELTRALEALGLDRTNWRAVALLPLIEVAWADGRIQRAERELLAEIALEHGIDPGEAFLTRWLARRPPKATFLAARTLLMRLWARAGQGQAPQPQTLDQLLDLCTEIAESAGGLFGLAFTIERSERDVIRDIASSLALGPTLPEPVRKAWSHESAQARPSQVRTEELRIGPTVDPHAATTRILVPRGRRGARTQPPLPPDDETTRITVRSPERRPVPLDEDHEATRPYLDDVPDDAPELADIDE